MLEVALIIVVIAFIVDICISGDKISSNRHRLDNLEVRVRYLEHLCIDESEENGEENGEESEDDEKEEEQDDEKDEDYTEGKKKK